MPVVGFEDWQVHKVNAVILFPLNKPLFSTSRMVQAGWRIVHDSEENGGLFALHRASGRKLKITVMGGVYKMPIWVQAVFQLAGRTPVRPAEQSKEGVSPGHFGQSHGRDRFDHGRIKEVAPLDGEPGDVVLE